MSNEFDVFVSYSSRDRALVLRLARDLEDQGLRVWIDVWAIVPGELWRARIERAIQEVPAVVVCHGPNGLGPTQRTERDVAIERAEHEGIVVLPILLPGGDMASLSAAERQRTWMDLRETWDQRKDVAKALRGRTRHVVLGTGGSPYRGLAPFREQDARFFFGREQETSELLKALMGGVRLMVLWGLSGSGKSSLVRAGLVPEIVTGALGGETLWRLILLRPGDRPLRELSLKVLGSAPTVPAGAAPDAAALVEKLLRSAATLEDELALRERSADDRWLIIVDQLEEVFELACSEEGGRFLDALVSATRAPRGHVAVIATLRAEVVPQALRSRVLSALWDHAARMVLPPLGEGQLRDAICCPARIAGGDVEPAVVDALITEVQGEAGRLPLLQNALLALWDRRDPQTGVVSWAAWRALGGAQNTLVQQAEMVEREFADEEGRSALLRALRALAAPGRANEDLRRVCLWTQCAEDVALRRALEKLVAGRLAIASEEGVELIHDVLLRSWPLLRRLLSDERESMALYAELVEDAEVLAAARPHAELWSAGKVGRAIELLQGRFPLSPPQRDLLERSKQAVDAERMERERLLRVEAESARRAQEVAEAATVAAEARAEAARLRVVAELERYVGSRRLLWASGLATFALVAGVVLATQQASQARLAEGRARESALLASARLVGMSDPTTAALLLDEMDAPADLGAWSAELSAQIAAGVAEVVLDVPDDIKGMAWSLDGAYLAVSTSANSLLMWETDAWESPWRVDTSGCEFLPIWSTQGELAVFCYGGDHVLFLRPDSRSVTYLTVGFGGQGPLADAQFSQDGRALAILRVDGRLALLRAENTGWQVTAIYDDHPGAELRRFDRDATMAWSADQTLHLASIRAEERREVEVSRWRTDESISAETWASAAPLAELFGWDSDAEVLLASQEGQLVALSEAGLEVTASPRSVTAASWAPKARGAATGDSNGRVEVHLRRLSGPPTADAQLEGAVQQLLWSPDSAYLAMVSSLETTLMDAQGRERLERLPGVGRGARHVAWGPDGRLATATVAEGPVRIWTLDDLGGQRLGRHGGETDPLLAVDPVSGRLAFSASRHIELLDGDRPRTFWSGWPITGIAWSNAGFLAATDRTGSIHLWRPSGSRTGYLAAPGIHLLDVAWSDDGRLLGACGEKGTFVLYELGPEGRLQRLDPMLSGVVEYAIHPDSTKIALGDVWGGLWVYDSSSNQSIRLGEKLGPVGELAWTDGGRRLVVNASKVWVYDWPSGHRTQLNIGHELDRSMLVPSPGGRHVLLRTAEMTSIMVMDGRSLEPVLTLRQGRQRLFSPRWSPDGERVAAVARDGSVWIWTLSDPERPFSVLVRDGGAMEIAWRGSEELIIAYPDGLIRAWPVTPEGLRGLLHRSTGSCLDGAARQQYLKEDPESARRAALYCRKENAARSLQGLSSIPSGGEAAPTVGTDEAQEESQSEP